MATAARTPKLDSIIKRHAKKCAIVDQVTRYEGTYIMIRLLLELKEVLVNIASSDITFTEQQWHQAEELESLLKEPFLLTKKMQGEDITRDTFIKEFRKLSHIIKKNGGLLAEKMEKINEKERGSNT